jgi:hypothetical protein
MRTCARDRDEHRPDLAGDRLYFSKAPAVGKAFRLGEQIAAGVPLAQAFATVGRE